MLHSLLFLSYTLTKHTNFHERRLFMKKSSLITVALASLVGLVGCNNGGASGPSKVSPEEFDTKMTELYESFIEKYAAGEAEFPERAVLTYSWDQVVTGDYIEPSVPSGVYKGTFSFHVAVDASYNWVVEPQPGEEWDAEDLAAAEEIIEDCYLNSTMFAVIWNYAAYGYDLAQLLVGEGFDFEFYLNPISCKYSSSGEGTEQGVNYVYSLIESFVYDDLGFITGYVNHVEETDSGAQVGSINSTETYAISYIPSNAQQ